jgi:alginate O-acetyltransferase complex protein AlgJ
MKKLVLRSLLFFSPFVVILAMELFILPIDFFTFRVWEALKIRTFYEILPGQFYPCKEIEKIEAGDLGYYTPFEVKKKVRWVTDRYGYRKKDSEKVRHKVVIIGDSNIAGTSLTQEDILSEVLENRLGVSVYPFAPENINTFLKESRFIDHPPETVILGTIESEILSLPNLLQDCNEEGTFSLLKWRAQLRGNRYVQYLVMQLDRLSKTIMLNYLKARLKGERVRPSYISATKFGTMLFFFGRGANRDFSIEQFSKTIHTIVTYDQALKMKGIRFIFLPIPNKENIYHDYLPRQERPVFLERLIAELKDKNIEVVDTQRAFEERYRKHSSLLYHLDDTHWNENAVYMTAGLIQEIIEKQALPLSTTPDLATFP